MGRERVPGQAGRSQMPTAARDKPLPTALPFFPFSFPPSRLGNTRMKHSASVLTGLPGRDRPPESMTEQTRRPGCLGSQEPPPPGSCVICTAHLAPPLQVELRVACSGGRERLSELTRTHAQRTQHPRKASSAPSPRASWPCLLCCSLDSH